MAEIARERVRYRANGYAPVDPVVSANGSRDAFYIKVDKYYGPRITRSTWRTESRP